MMKPGMLIDTDILIDVARGSATAIEFIATREQAVVIGISLITRMEILAGCRDKQEMAQAYPASRRSASTNRSARSPSACSRNIV